VTIVGLAVIGLVLTAILLRIIVYYATSTAPRIMACRI